MNRPLVPRRILGTRPTILTHTEDPTVRARVQARAQERVQEQAQLIDIGLRP